MVSTCAILFLIRFVLQIHVILTDSVIKMQHRNQDSKYTDIFNDKFQNVYFVSLCV